MAPELRPRKETPYSSTKKRTASRKPSVLPLPDEFPADGGSPSVDGKGKEPSRGRTRKSSECGPKAAAHHATPWKSSAASSRSAKKAIVDSHNTAAREVSTEFQKSMEESTKFNKSIEESMECLKSLEGSMEFQKSTEQSTEFNKSIEESTEFKKLMEDLAEFKQPTELTELAEFEKSTEFKQSTEFEQSTQPETKIQEYSLSLIEEKTHERNGRIEDSPSAEYSAKLRKCAQVLQQDSDDEQEKKSVKEEVVIFDKMSETQGVVEETEDEDEADDEEIASLFVSSFKAHLRHSSNCSNTLKEQFTTDMTSISRNKAGLMNDSGNVLDIVEQRISRTVRDAEQISWTPNIGLDTKNYSDFSSQLDIDNRINSKRIVESMWKQDGQLQDGLLVPSRNPRKLNKLSREQAKDSVGAKWFDLVAPTMTPELKKDLQLLKLRGAIDPKRHYKAEDSKALPKYFQVGTVVEGPADFYSGRLTKRQRKTSLADELLSDSNLKSYRKKKYLKIQDEKQAGGKKFWKQKKNKQKPSWAKT